MLFLILFSFFTSSLTVSSTQIKNKSNLKKVCDNNICTIEKNDIDSGETLIPPQSFKLKNKDLLALNPLKYREDISDSFGNKIMPFSIKVLSNDIWIGGRIYKEGSWDAYICLFEEENNDLELRWYKTFDYYGYDETIRDFVFEGGSIFAVGHSTKGNNRLILLKYDAYNGDFEDGKIMGTSSQPKVGTAISKYNGDIYIVGSREYEDGLYRVIINKFTTDLDYEWGYYLNPFEEGPEYGYNFDLYNGKAYITGVCHYVGHEFQLYPFMIKFNVNSEKITWSNTYGMAWWSQVSQSCVCYGNKIYYTAIDMGKAASMDIMFSYIRESDGWEDGTVDRYWGDYYDDDLSYDIIERNGRFYTAGSTESYGTKAFDAVLIKTDGSFNVKWYEKWGGSSDEEAYAAFSYGSNIFTTGYTKSYGSASISGFILKYSDSGSLLWSHTWSQENGAPDKPNKPSGKTDGAAGNTYRYSTSTTDPDGDNVYYWFDWGDGTNSGWKGPYESGDTCTAGHYWEYGNYKIRVRAKDDYGGISEWSGEKSISMPKTKTIELLSILKSTKIKNFLSILFQ